ncbi:MAG: hypothetical protein WC777_00930 [Candidatus Gracilibacteria bacterium]|jgi:hypothetical protein
MNDRRQIFLGLFILLVSALYGVYQWNQREALQISANTLNTQAVSLNMEYAELQEQYSYIKVESGAAREVAAQELSVVFPTSEDLTMLTRLLDDFAVRNNFEGNPFFISSLSYETAKASEDGQYRSVPVRLSITSSKKNLGEFLEFIENSGSLEAGVRLMSIEDLKIQYPLEFGGTYDIQVDLNAYFSQEI